MIAVTKDEILAAMAAEQSALAQLLESLDEATMVRPGVYDNLSIKDVLAHLATWELMASEWIQTSLRGETPVRFTPGFQLDGEDTESIINWFNESIFQANRDLPLKAVLERLKEAQAQTRATLALLTESDLNEPGRFAWRGGEPLWPNQRGNTFGHYQ